ncbi:MAG: gamma-glutamyl-gamma-aminobutyrate hydrolase family protein, partial [Chloroflexi bacterium]|nr:gamma-glutamyl-gamma-aminobutyrate hydrolase family protein [Chloroflexota bacterium]
MRPLISITTHPKSAPDRAVLDQLLEMIISSVERANGLPMIIPLGLSENTLRELYARCDGVLFSGGGDIDPTHYSATTHEKIDGVDAERDRVELMLAKWIADDDKPFFGICRGTQILNVALGGSLYRDISEHASASRHTYYPDFTFDLRPHEIKIEEDSTLAKVIGKPILSVNSLHHQACKDLAPQLVASARAPDGIIEAVEIAHHPFALAVLWHPECLPEDGVMRGLFEVFV